MLNFIIAFIASLVFDVVVTTQLGDIADKRQRATMWQPVVAGAAVIGMGEALSGIPGILGYVLGSTFGTWLAMKWRRSD